MDLVPSAQTSFWQRMGLDETCRGVCIEATRRAFPGCAVQEFGQQGYCSYTLLITFPHHASRSPSSLRSLESRNSPCHAKQLVQFRPQQHTLYVRITAAARSTYADLAPAIQKLDMDSRVGETMGLDVFAMNMMSGMPYSQTQIRRVDLHDGELRRQARMVEELAAFVARAWPGDGRGIVQCRATRADSPMSESSTISFPTTPRAAKAPSFLRQCTGKVGVRIVPKLEQLAAKLPSPALRRCAADTLHQLLQADDDDEWPVVLNHGDLIPSNILIDAETGAMTGVVDWAEAEWLPFGTCLYALEHLLGYLETSEDPSPSTSASASASASASTSTSTSASAPTRLRLMRDVGVLLWYGYAWDEGRIDRVVNEEDDAVEVTCLRAYLSVRW
ncbi:hypothetical protein K491DRAFT_606392 [Lophiostoma macrostomum CBS 122681]|uniref:Aminoglycoside phosphotransferase domain-containing protein n=1 Tax=Lophiostoma macrostomum CBS 122681 TaxID=1314788 RepID=A0A6A6SVJ9_9PLEO|nr:hypothetical protein K491DRAFT_606392 [Lophiostoma macrostomum CBS 122681]